MTAPSVLVAQVTFSPLLDPPTRAVLLMSLLAFVLLGIGLMVGAMLGGRWVRRMGGVDLTKPLPLRRGREVEAAPAMLRAVHWGTDCNTAALDSGASETVSR